MRWTIPALSSLALIVLLTGCPESKGTYEASCTPDCQGRECGDDGCGGSCGSCPADSGVVCNETGQCVAAWRPDLDALELRTDPYEVFIPDADNEKICLSLGQQFDALVEGASSCESTLDCDHRLTNRLPCSCAIFVSDGSIEGAAGKLATAYEDDYDCLAGVACGACPWAEVPACTEGLCRATQPGCEALSQAYGNLLQEARVCTDDADCVGQVAGSLTCTCMVPIHGDVATTFFDAAMEYWQSNECGQPVPCECIEYDNVGCVDGLCDQKPDSDEQGSQACEQDDDCIPISGCNCGCWSVPPAGEEPEECPCAAPAACMCIDGVCEPAIP